MCNGFRDLSVDDKRLISKRQWPSSLLTILLSSCQLLVIELSGNSRFVSPGKERFLENGQFLWVTVNRISRKGKNCWMLKLTILIVIDTEEGAVILGSKSLFPPPEWSLHFFRLSLKSFNGFLFNILTHCIDSFSFTILI